MNPPSVKDIKLAEIEKDLEEHLTPEEKKAVSRSESKGIRTYACPKCGNAYRGKHITGIIVCGRCGWRRKDAPKRKADSKPNN